VITGPALPPATSTDAPHAAPPGPGAPAAAQGAPDISEVWPEVFDAVVGALRRRGIGLHSAEDATQEAGSRVLTNGIGFADADDLRRWVQTVAWRVAIDETRRLARHDGVGRVAETASFQEVPAEVENRLRLAATSKAWRALSAADREAIMGEGDVHPLTRKEAVRLNVRRHRARARLLALVEGVAAIVLVPFRRVRRVTAAVVLAAAVPITAIVLPFVGDPPAPSAGGSAPGVAHAHAAGAVAGAGRAAAATPAAVTRPVSPEAPRVDLPRGGATPRTSTYDHVNAHIDTPMENDKDPYLRNGPKEPGKPIACLTTPATAPACTPPLPVTVPAPPDPTGLL
jgi:hypothetical protein